jgi:hypothetical protein
MPTVMPNLFAIYFMFGASCGFQTLDEVFAWDKGPEGVFRTMSLVFRRPFLPTPPFGSHYLLRLSLNRQSIGVSSPFGQFHSLLQAGK